jgi:hypothetical protein
MNIITLPYPKCAFEVGRLNAQTNNDGYRLPLAPLLPGLAELLIELANGEPEIELRYFEKNSDGKWEASNLSARGYYPGDEDLECVLEVRETHDGDDELDNVDYYQASYAELIVRATELIETYARHDESGCWYITILNSRHIAEHLLNRSMVNIQRQISKDLTEKTREKYNCPYKKYIHLIRSRPKLTEPYSNSQ